MKIKILSLVLTILSMSLIACSNASETDEKDWSHNFIIWEGDMFIPTEEVVTESDLEIELGQVNSFSDNEVSNIDTNLIFSNYFAEGSKIYKIVGVKTSESLAVKEGSTLTKLIYNGKYGK